MRAPAVWIALVAACGEAAPRDDAPQLGARADPIALWRSLVEVAAGPRAGRGDALAAAVLDACGPDCACLAAIVIRREAETTCPAVAPRVPPGWPPLELCGRYLAGQLAAAAPWPRALLAAALAQLEVPVARVDPRWPVPDAASDGRPLSPTQLAMTVDDRGAIAVAPMPAVRFGAAGAQADAPVPRPAVGRGGVRDAIARAMGRPVAAPTPDEPPVFRTFRVIAGAPRPSSPDRPTVAADPAAPVGGLADALAAAGGVLAVRGPDAIREVPAELDPEPWPDSTDVPYAITLDRGWIALWRGGVRLDRAPHEGTSYQGHLARWITSLRDVSPRELHLVIHAGTARDVVVLLDAAVALRPPRIGLSLPESGFAGGTATHRRQGVTTVELRTVDAGGGARDALARRTLHRHVGAYEACHLEVDPGTRALITAEFALRANGLPQAIHVASPDPRLTGCIREALRHTAFPAIAPGLVRVRAVLVLAPD